MIWNHFVEEYYNFEDFVIAFSDCDARYPSHSKTDLCFGIYNIYIVLMILLFLLLKTYWSHFLQYDLLLHQGILTLELYVCFFVSIQCVNLRRLEVLIHENVPFLVIWCYMILCSITSQLYD